MKSTSLFLFLLLFFSVHSQTLNEEQQEDMANFSSVLIDYTVHEDKVVAITRKNREYFLFFEDSKGAKLFQSIDIFFATDLEIDCMGNLFLVGLDSAIQLEIDDYVNEVETLDIESYKANIRTCRALFKESIVKESINNSLIYEPIDDSIFAKHPVLFAIQLWYDQSSGVVVRSPNSRSMSRRDVTLVDNNQINIMNDGLSASRPSAGRGTGIVRSSKGHGTVASELTAFQVGDSLWVFSKKSEIMIVYDEYGKSEGVKEIEDLPFEFKLLQDQQTQEIYVISNDGGVRIIQQIDKNGKLSEGVKFYKGFSKSYLKISNGYLYFRDSKGAGEWIRRIKLEQE